MTGAERGSASVEFALVIPAVLLVLLALVEVAVVARAQMELLSAARHGVRVAATNPAPEAAVDAIHRVLSDELAARVVVTVERPSVVGRDAVVRLSAEHRLLSVLFGGIPLELSAGAVMRVER